MNGYVKTFKAKDVEKDKNNKLFIFRYRWWEAIEDVKNKT